MTKEDDFINELKLQARRDLDGVEIMLQNNGPIEHGAYLCQQSFEKNIKYVYAYYKLRINKRSLSGVYDDTLKSSHEGGADLTMNMLPQYYTETYKFINSKMAENTPMLPPQLRTLFLDQFTR